MADRLRRCNRILIFTVLAARPAHPLSCVDPVLSEVFRRKYSTARLPDLCGSVFRSIRTRLASDMGGPAATSHSKSARPRVLNLVIRIEPVVGLGAVLSDGGSLPRPSNNEIAIGSCDRGQIGVALWGRSFLTP